MRLTLTCQRSEALAADIDAHHWWWLRWLLRPLRWIAHEVSVGPDRRRPRRGKDDAIRQRGLGEGGPLRVRDALGWRWAGLIRHRRGALRWQVSHVWGNFIGGREAFKERGRLSPSLSRAFKSVEKGYTTAHARKLDT